MATEDGGSLITRGQPKFDASLNDVVDTERINLTTIECLLIKYLEHKCPDSKELIVDLILHFLKSERFPDPKTLQCEIADFKFLNANETKKLITLLWQELLVQQRRDNSGPSAKYLKASSSSGNSSSRISTSNDNRHGQNGHQRYHN